jgi:hypothetical protein
MTQTENPFQFTKMLRAYDWICAALALVTGIFTAWVDVHNNEVQPAVLLLLLFGMLLGFAQPRGAWRWGLITGGCIPAAYFVLPLVGVTSVGQLPVPAYTTFIALIPAFIGTYSGVLASKLAHYISER